MRLFNSNNDPRADSEPPRKMGMNPQDSAASRCPGCVFPGYPSTQGTPPREILHGASPQGIHQVIPPWGSSREIPHGKPQWDPPEEPLCGSSYSFGCFHVTL